MHPTRTLMSLAATAVLACTSPAIAGTWDGNKLTLANGEKVTLTPSDVPSPSDPLAPFAFGGNNEVTLSGGAFTISGQDKTKSQANTLIVEKGASLAVGNTGDKYGMYADASFVLNALVRGALSVTSGYPLFRGNDSTVLEVDGGAVQLNGGNYVYGGGWVGKIWVRNGGTFTGGVLPRVKEVVVDNATLQVEKFGNNETSLPADAMLTFRGEAPMFRVNTATSKIRFILGRTSTDPSMEVSHTVKFELPATPYATAPITKSYMSNRPLLVYGNTKFVFDVTAVKSASAVIYPLATDGNTQTLIQSAEGDVDAWLAALLSNAEVYASGFKIEDAADRIQFLVQNDALCVQVLPGSGKTQVSIPTLDGETAVYTGLEQKPTVTFDESVCTLSWQTGAGAWTNAGVWTVTATLKDVETTEWVDGTTEPKELPFEIAKAQDNAWERDPSLGANVFNQGEGTTIDCGTATFGRPVASYSEDDLKALPAGAYRIEFSVAETESYPGLSIEIAFQVRDGSIPAPGDPDTAPTAYTWIGGEMGFWYDSRKWTTETSPCYGYPNSGAAETASTAIFKDVVATVRGDASNAITTYDLTMTGSQLTFAEGVFAVKNSMKTTKSANASAITVEDGASLVFSAEKALDLTKAPSTVTVRGTLSSETQYLFAKGSGAGSTLDVDGGTVSVPGQLTANTYGSGEFMHTTVRNGGKIAVKNMVLGDGEVTDATIEDSGNIYFLGDVTLSSATISADNYIYAFGNNKSLTVDGATTFTFSRLYVGCNNASAGLFVATNYSFIAKSPLELSRAGGQFNLGETGSKNVNFVIDNTTVTLDSGIAATVKSAAEGSFIELKGADAKLLMPKATLTVGVAGGAAQSNGLRFRLPATPYAEPPVKKLAGGGSGALNIYGNAVIELDITDVLKHQTYPLVFEGRNKFSTDNAAVNDSGSTEAYLKNLAANMRVVKKREDGSFRTVGKECVTLSIADGVLYADVHPTTGLVILLR